MNLKTLSLVVPIYNMSGYLNQLWASLLNSGLYDVLDEIIFVNDGSSDETGVELDQLVVKSPKVKHLNLEKNSGRFVARLAGAQASQARYILFLDARVELAPGFGPALVTLLKQHEALMGMVKIDVAKSVFNLYWQRTHETIFKKHFRDAKKGFYLTPVNYEQYAKGTTVFLCPRPSFLKACEKFENETLHSDDTFLMREIVKEHKIWVDEKIAINWEPRQDYRSFWLRLWERGPQFAEYHVFERHGLYFYLFLCWSILVSVTLFLVFFRPLLGLSLLIGGLVTLAFSTALFARTPLEFFRMIPVHVGAILAYGLGAIYGVGVNLNLFRKPPPTAAHK